MNDQQKKVFFQWWNENWKSVFVVFAIIITLILAFVKFPWAAIGLIGAAPFAVENVRRKHEEKLRQSTRAGIKKITMQMAEENEKLRKEIEKEKKKINKETNEELKANILKDIDSN